MTRVGVRQIAEKCGVSPMTVSRVLNGKTGLHRRETVARVVRTARELGYRPNLLARSMQSGRTRTIGFLHQAGAGAWTAELQLGVHDELVRRGYLPITLLLSRDTSVSEHVNHLLDRRVDGIVLRPLPTAPSVECLALMRRHDLPVVTIDTELPEAADYDFVGTDDDLGGRLAAKHLLGLRHRRFGALCYDEGGATARRCRSFERSVSKHPGVHVARVEVSLSDLIASRGALRLLRSKPRPTAIFAGADRLAWTVYRAAAQLGLRIPEDLSVVGFADLEYARMLTPALTTFRQNTQDIGREAVRMVLGRIEGTLKGKPRRVLLKPEIVPRASTCPAR
ncbi:MAG: LacI family DNA-binding transcriptional regulator [Candidatus Sumerlaeota bacterium]|nr:LacI family DNA-binding transcriptional regulator [Candidatus Sumerlaeota bacterium]